MNLCVKSISLLLVSRGQTHFFFCVWDGKKGSTHKRKDQLTYMTKLS